MAETQTATRTAEEAALASFHGFIARDVDEILRNWHPDGIQDWLAIGIFRGHAEIRAAFVELFTAVPDMEATIERVLSDDRACMIQWRTRGTHSGGPLRGVEATGRHMELRGVDVMEVEDGLVVRNTIYYDGAAVARGMGMLPPQDSGAERTMISAFNGVNKLRRAVADLT